MKRFPDTQNWLRVMAEGQFFVFHGIIIDSPGCLDNFEDYKNAAYQEIKKRNIPKPMIPMGYSLGGGVVFNLASEYPEEFLGCLL